MTGTCNQHFWTPEEDEQLRMLLREKPELTYPQLGQEMGMTTNQVIGRRARLKLRKAPCKFNGHKWSPERHATMCALLDEGHPASEIGRRMGLTKNAIIGRCHRTGLSEERYAGPTAMERLDAINGRMDNLLEWQNMIFGSRRVGYKIPPLTRSIMGNGRRAVLGGFGARSLGYDQRDYDAPARSTEISR